MLENCFPFAALNMLFFSIKCTEGGREGRRDGRKEGRKEAGQGGPRCTAPPTYTILLYIYILILSYRDTLNLHYIARIGSFAGARLASKTASMSELLKAASCQPFFVGRLLLVFFLFALGEARRLPRKLSCLSVDVALHRQPG